MPDLVNKLSTYAALLGVIGAIGGGFMAWGEFNNRIAQLENKEFVVNETVDLSDINQKIENFIKEIETLKGDIKINNAKIDFVDAKLNELKVEQSNPLGG
jgi:peptidoglycan hydrolase CwlO-like protein